MALEKIDIRRSKKTDKKKNLKVVKFSVENTENPDLMKFSALAGYVDVPTDATPCGGASGYKTIIEGESADVQSLVGMGVNVSYWDDYKSHDPYFKIGTITAASVEGNEIHVEGHLWKNDFPDICDTIECAKDSMGCSVEVYFDGIVYDNEAKTVLCKGAHFTGLAILYKNKAAFKNTSIMCSIKDTEGEEMNEEVKQALEAIKTENAEAIKALTDTVNKLSENVQALSAAPEKDDTKAGEEVQDEDKDKGAVDNAQELSAAISTAVSEGVKQALAAIAPKNDEADKEAGKEAGGRKTALDFAGVPNENHTDKTYMELAAEVDADEKLTDSQKWAKKLEIWNNREAE